MAEDRCAKPLETGALEPGRRLFRMDYIDCIVHYGLAVPVLNEHVLTKDLVPAAQGAFFPAVEELTRMKKQSAGNVPAAETPSYIRSVDSVLSSGDRQYLKLKLAQKLRKFAPEVMRSSVRVEDVNGPRGGVDKRCRIKVVLRGLPSVVVEELHESLRPAMDGALNRMERAVRRATDRRRMKPLKGGPPALPTPTD